MWCIGRCRSRWSVDHPLVLWWSLLLLNIWTVACCLVSCSSCCVGLCECSLPCFWWWQWRECMCWCVLCLLWLCGMLLVVGVVRAACVVVNVPILVGIVVMPLILILIPSLILIPFGSILDFDSILDCNCASLPTWLWLLWIRELIEGRNSKIKSRKSLSTELYRHVCMMFVKFMIRLNY